MKKIAVILSGCGYLDGAEIRESVLALLALDLEGAAYEMFALDKHQHHVVNHMSGEEEAGETRNILQESARIARGHVKPLAALDENYFDALIMPGGFGVAKNMCSFAFDGGQGTVDEMVLKKVKAFTGLKKPIGAICIAPALIALALGDQGPTLTIGKDVGIAEELESIGVKHQQCETYDCVVDEKNKLVSTPAYMDDDAKLADVYSGVSKLVKHVVQLC